MDFEAAANLVAALRPFVHATKHANLEGFERLVRAASRLTGELSEVQTIMPARPVRRHRPGVEGPHDTPTSPETGDTPGNGPAGNSGLEAVSVDDDPPDSRPPDLPADDRFAVMLFLILLLLVLVF